MIGAVGAVGAQAKQEVDRSDDKIPGPDDAQWASSIHQTADKHFSFMRPSVYYPEGTLVQLEGQDSPVQVTPNLFVMRKLKERFNKPRDQWLLHFDPALLALEELDVRSKVIDADY